MTAKTNPDRKTEGTLPGVAIRYLDGTEARRELAALRRAAYVEERGFLPEADLFTSNDDVGTHVALIDEASGKLIGTTHIALAEETDFPRHSGLAPSVLAKSVLSSRTCVDPDFRGRGYIVYLLYLALRWARMQGRTQLVGYVEEGEPPAARLLSMRSMRNVPPRTVRGSQADYTVVPVWQRLDVALDLAFKKLPRGLKTYVTNELFVDELAALVERNLQRFYMNPWFVKAREKKLTKAQYVEGVCNLHLYVRWTTRLLARVAGITADRDLRKHFLAHLNGEIDHEVMLEKDLAVLGFDVEFVKATMAPDPSIYSFMAVQQSLVAFEQDPALFLMAPLVAEALSANLTDDFIASLEQNIASWGVERPKAAMTFLRSHVYTDGGEDGHWAAVKRILAGRLVDEAAMQKALCLVEAMFQQHEQAYRSFMTTIDLEAAPSAHAPHLATQGLPTVAPRVAEEVAG
jgi:GNAT superfamily N-acetyltransferase